MYNKIIEELAKCKKEEQWSEYQDGYNDAIFEAIQIVRQHAEGEEESEAKQANKTEMLRLAKEYGDCMIKAIGIMQEINALSKTPYPQYERGGVPPMPAATEIVSAIDGLSIINKPH